jgi:uncharacterized protein (TIGR00251 family)
MKKNGGIRLHTSLVAETTAGATIFAIRGKIVGFLVATPKGVTVRVKVQPGAKKSEFAGVEGDELKIRVTAPAREGEANRECVRFLAKALGLARSDVEIVRGARSRHKVMLLREISEKAIQDLSNKFQRAP